MLSPTEYKQTQSHVEVHRGLVPGPCRHQHLQMPKSRRYTSLRLTYPHPPVYFKSSQEHLWYRIQCRCYGNSCMLYWLGDNDKEKCVHVQHRHIIVDFTSSTQQHNVTILFLIFLTQRLAEPVDVEPADGRGPTVYAASSAVFHPEAS